MVPVIDTNTIFCRAVLDFDLFLPILYTSRPGKRSSRVILPFYYTSLREFGDLMLIHLDQRLVMIG
jgi:hypothetical protein